MKKSFTYTPSLRAALPRIIIVGTFFAIAPAPFYEDLADRLIKASFMIFAFVLLCWIPTRSYAIKINEKSLQGFVALAPWPRSRIIAWEDISSVTTIGSWAFFKCYVIETKNLSPALVYVPFHLNNKRDFKNKVKSFSGKDSPLSRALGKDL